MAHPKTAKVTAAGAARDLRNVELLPGGLDREITGSPRELQVSRLIARFGWTRPRAAVVALLAFGEVHHG